MVIMVSYDRKEIPESAHNTRKRRPERRKRGGELLQDRPFVRRVNTNTPSLPKRFQQGYGKNLPRVAHLLVQKLLVAKFTGRLLDMIRPLNREGLIGSGVREPGHRQHNRFKVEMVHRILDSLQHMAELRRHPLDILLHTALNR